MIPAAKAVGSVIGNPRIGEFLFNKIQDKESSIYFIKVNPDRIGYISWFPSRTPLLREKNARTGICGGIWDFFKSPFPNHFMYQAYSEYLAGASLNETLYYRKLLKTRNEKEALKQVQTLTELSEKLQENGYLSQNELGATEPSKQIGLWKIPGNEIVVAMGRRGELIRIAGGRHRLAIAQQIDIPEVYAVLTLIHPKAADKLPEKRRLVTGSDEDFMPIE